jgi:hypothetical protein
MTVGTDYDRSADFSKYKSFDLAPAPEFKNPLMRDRIESAIAGQLEGKGFVRSGAQPDFIVAVHGKLGKETQFDTTSFGYGWGGGWGYWGRAGMGTSTTVARQVPVGTLIVDVVDAREKKLVWQAVASDTLDPQASAEKRDKLVNEAMAKIFASFPPTGK